MLSFHTNTKCSHRCTETSHTQSW